MSIIGLEIAALKRLGSGGRSCTTALSVSTVLLRLKGRRAVSASYIKMPTAKRSSGVERLTSHLLRAHVAVFPLDHAMARPRHLGRRLGDPKSTNLT